jgi:hypothetical protein
MAAFQNDICILPRGIYKTAWTITCGFSILYTALYTALQFIVCTYGRIVDPKPVKKRQDLQFAVYVCAMIYVDLYKTKTSIKSMPGRGHRFILSVPFQRDLRSGASSLEDQP